MKKELDIFDELPTFTYENGKFINTNKEDLEQRFNKLQADFYLLVENVKIFMRLFKETEDKVKKLEEQYGKRIKNIKGFGI